MGEPSPVTQKQMPETTGVRHWMGRSRSRGASAPRTHTLSTMVGPTARDILAQPSGLGSSHEQGFSGPTVRDTYRGGKGSYWPFERSYSSNNDSRPLK